MIEILKLHACNVSEPILLQGCHESVAMNGLYFNIHNVDF